jgi:hypothetical protein
VGALIRSAVDFVVDQQNGFASWIVIQNTLRDKVTKAEAFSSIAKYYRQAWREPIEE